MTIKDKYLKDNVNIELLADTLTDYFEENVEELKQAQDDHLINALYDNTIKYFNTKIIPTLTNDERVILRNIDKRYKRIGRDSGDIQFCEELEYIGAWHNVYEFNHLFQFIKERRRIRN